MTTSRMILCVTAVAAMAISAVAQPRTAGRVQADVFDGAGRGSDRPPFDPELVMPTPGTVGAVQCGSTTDGCGCDPASCAAWTPGGAVPADDDLQCFQVGVTERFPGDCLFACPGGKSSECFAVPTFPQGPQLCASEAARLVQDPTNGLLCYSVEAMSTGAEVCTNETAIPIDLIPEDSRPRFNGPNYDFCLPDEPPPPLDVCTNLLKKDCRRDEFCWWRQGVCNEGPDCTFFRSGRQRCLESAPDGYCKYYPRREDRPERCRNTGRPFDNGGFPATIQRP